jgi:CubicO group peptidase (beta-lactamase class C family)
MTPGEITSYSTYGVTLAGLLVEQISGLPFEEYLKRNIWTPLGMSRTSITVPASQRSWVAVGYELVRDALVPQPWEWYHTTPASSVNATADDMAKFIIAHLREGERGGARILSDRAARYMQRQHATVHPRLPGFALGFYEDYVGQLRVIEHGGQVAGFASLMVLMPQQQDGFIIMHHRENARLRDDLKEALLTRYYADARRRLPLPVAASSFKARVSLFTGRYAPTTSCHSCTPRQVPYILEVKATADSTALIMTGSEWIEVEPLLFARRDGTGYIAFRRGNSGAVQYMFAGGSWSWERLPD